MGKGKKIWLLVIAIALLAGVAVGVWFAVGSLGGQGKIVLDYDNVYFEFGRRINLPDTTVYDRAGKELAYDSTCIAMIAPDGTEVDVSSGFITPMQQGVYVLTYASVSTGIKTDIEVECKDTIAPTLNVEVPEAYLIKALYEDTEFTVFTLPIMSADDLAGIDASRTEVKITVNGKEAALNGDQFVLTEEGDLVFSFTVYDMNGLSTTVTKESIAALPEQFGTYCLSTFAKDTYLTKICGGWLNSYYTASILESDTDPSGRTEDGVLKITYDTSDEEAGACIHLARPVKLEDVEYLAVTLRLENASVTAEVVDAVFYKAEYRDGFWTINNVSTTVGSSYKTIYIGKAQLETFVEGDGYIRQFQIETFGDGKNARSLYLADVSYGPKGSQMPSNGNSGGGGYSGGTTGNLNDNFPQYCLSTFAIEAYKYHLCGGWRQSAFTASILSSDTDSAGRTENGVLKITYPASDDEAGACIHLGRAVKRSDIASLEITLRLENCRVIDNGTVDAVFYKSNYTKGYWTVRNLSTMVGKNYVTVSITESALDAMTDSDGYIRQLQIETFGDEKTTRSIYLADISYTPAKTDEPVEQDPLVIYGTINSVADTVYFSINQETGLSDNTDIANLSNEETHILLNDQAWSSQSIGANSGKSFYIDHVGAVYGTKLTVLKGFSLTLNDVTYVTNEAYNFWWDGSAWTPTELEPEISDLPENVLSAFDSELYLKRICGGWLRSAYEASVLVSDTDSTGRTENGVLKITYPSGDEETSACIHLGRAIKRSDIAALEITLRLENCSVIENGTLDAVFFKSNYIDGYWTIRNLSTKVGENYVTVSITESVLDAMTDSDGYIRQLQIETFGDKKTARSIYLADISYKPVGGTTEPSEPTEPAQNAIVINGVNGANPNELLMTLPVDPNVKVGAKLTVKSGLTMTIEGVEYSTEQNYDFWWNGSAWTTEEVKPNQILTISDLGSGDADVLYFNINAETGVADWTNIAGVCNEETHILINDQAWSTQELGAISGKHFYVNHIGATVGTKLTLKQGFTATFNGTRYLLDKDYNYWWNGAIWTTEEVAAPEPEPPATEPNCLSAFDGDQYLLLMCDGWLNSPYEASILSSDTDSSGATQKGVMKITYPATDREATACIHLHTQVKREDVQSLDVTLRIEGNSKKDGMIDAIFYKAGYKNEYDTISNVSTAVGGNYVTISITGDALDTLTDDDGYIRQFQIATFGDGNTVRSVYLADVSYTPAAEDPTEPEKPAAEVLTIKGFKSFSEDRVLYFDINVDTVNGTGFGNWHNISSAANEETHILINDEAWSTQEVCAFEGNCFYVSNFGAEGVKKITVKQGFTLTLNGVDYVTEKDYDFWWTPVGWVTSYDTLVIEGLGAGESGILYFAINAQTGLANWTNIAGVCNEEDYILINDAAFGSREIGAITGKSFYVNNIGATVGTKLTIKAGFTAVFNGTAYVTDKDYSYTWNGSKWTLETA